MTYIEVEPDRRPGYRPGFARRLVRGGQAMASSAGLAWMLAVAIVGCSQAEDAVSITALPGGEPFEIMATTFELAPFGYAAEEYLFSGTASAYVAEGELRRDGDWTTRPDATAPYVARFYVRRPIDPAAFDGTVHVEWLNVTGGADAAVSWKYGHVEMLRSGTAYVGVTVQRVGIDAAREADPERYGELSHPGDSFSYDIFAQAGEAIRQNASTLLPGLDVKQLIASGESQSATRLITYINGVHSHHAGVYDGYLLFSSFARPAALSQEPQADIRPPEPARIRSDVGVPTLSLQTELELQAIIDPPAPFPPRGDTGLEPLEASRQPDTGTFRLWELPGASHAGAYLYNVGPRDDGSAARIEDFAMALIRPTGDKSGRGAPCNVPINADPIPWVFNAALRHLNRWAAGGMPPPAAARVATVRVDDRTLIARDDVGNALGGIRSPYVDAPVATLNGTGHGEGFCFLNGTTIPFSEYSFRMRYADVAAFVADWTDATDDAVASGFVLEDDRERLQGIGDFVSRIPVNEWRARDD